MQEETTGYRTLDYLFRSPIQVDPSLDNNHLQRKSSGYIPQKRPQQYGGPLRREVNDSADSTLQEIRCLKEACRLMAMRMERREVKFRETSYR